MSPSNEIEQYRITFDCRLDHLRVKVDGEHDSYEISIAYWREILREAKGSGRKEY